MATEEQEGHYSYAKQFLTSTAGHFRWPEEVILYHLPLEQELLSDTTSRLCFQTYLHLSKLNFTTKVLPNASSMSPDGTAPFIVLQLREQPLILSNFERLVDFLDKQHLGLGSETEPTDKVDQEAFISLVKMRILPAQQYQMWASRVNINETLRASGCGLPWPVNKVLPHLYLLHYVWHDWSTFIRPLIDVLRDFEQTCNTLSQRLGSRETFALTRLSALDVVVYSHLQAILSSQLPGKELKNILLQYENLTNLCQRISELVTITQTINQS